MRWIAHRACSLGGRHISKRLRDSKQKSRFGQRGLQSLSWHGRRSFRTVTRKGMPKTPGHRLRTTRGTGGGGRRVLPPQLERVRLERPSRARPKDITHKAPRGRLRDHRGCQNSPPVSSPQIQLYRRGMSRVSLIAQHFVRLRRRSAVSFPKPSILM